MCRCDVLLDQAVGISESEDVLGIVGGIPIVLGKCLACLAVLVGKVAVALDERGLESGETAASRYELADGVVERGEECLFELDSRDVRLEAGGDARDGRHVVVELGIGCVIAVLHVKALADEPLQKRAHDTAVDSEPVAFGSAGVASDEQDIGSAVGHVGDECQLLVGSGAEHLVHRLLDVGSAVLGCSGVGGIGLFHFFFSFSDGLWIDFADVQCPEKKRYSVVRPLYRCWKHLSSMKIYIFETDARSYCISSASPLSFRMLGNIPITTSKEKNMKFLFRWLATAIAAGVAVWLVPGIEIVGGDSAWVTIAIFGLFLSLIDMSVKPILQVLSIPITVLTLGIFYLIVNTLMLYLAGWLSNSIFDIGFYIASFGSAFVASIVISIVSSIMTAAFGYNND